MSVWNACNYFCWLSSLFPYIVELPNTCIELMTDFGTWPLLWCNSIILFNLKAETNHKTYTKVIEIVLFFLKINSKIHFFLHYNPMSFVKHLQSYNHQSRTVPSLPSLPQTPSRYHVIVNTFPCFQSLETFYCFLCLYFYLFQNVLYIE